MRGKRGRERRRKGGKRGRERRKGGREEREGREGGKEGRKWTKIIHKDQGSIVDEMVKAEAVRRRM
jgi:hypothetical protein